MFGFEEFLSLAKSQLEYFENKGARSNFRSEVANLHSPSGVYQISRKEANTLIHLHNSAYIDSLYGERLYHYLMILGRKKRIEQHHIDHLYMLSIDWPLDMQVDPIY